MIRQKTIAQIIDQNHVFASVLYYFGIDIYQSSESTLEELCKTKGLKLQAVIDAFEEIDDDEKAQRQILQQLPIDLIIEYLKHSHFIFIKRRLPFLSTQIQGLKVNDGPPGIIKDLQWIFPVFTEDFIHHIYQEEDQLFTYLLDLNDVVSNKQTPSKMYFRLEKGSLQSFAVEHVGHDEEMKGLDKILQGVENKKISSLRRFELVVRELQSFKQVIINHGKVENEILFPKALLLESKVKELIKETSSLN